MSLLPIEVLRVIEQDEGFWSEKAEISRLQLRLRWADVIRIARTAVRCKRTLDPNPRRDLARRKGYVYAVVGRDDHGRQIYMAGKIIRYDEEKFWKVITIHEATG